MKRHEAVIEREMARLAELRASIPGHVDIDTIEDLEIEDVVELTVGQIYYFKEYLYIYGISFRSGMDVTVIYLPHHVTNLPYSPYCPIFATLTLSIALLFPFPLAPLSLSLRHINV